MDSKRFLGTAYTIKECNIGQGCYNEGTLRRARKEGKQAFKQDEK